MFLRAASPEDAVGKRRKLLGIRRRAEAKDGEYERPQRHGETRQNTIRISKMLHTGFILQKCLVTPMAEKYQKVGETYNAKYNAKT